MVVQVNRIFVLCSLDYSVHNNTKIYPIHKETNPEDLKNIV